MALTDLEKTAIVIIAIIVYYVIMMIISIILAKTNHLTAARWVKTLSILNYPLKKLNEYSVHIDENNKYRVITETYVANKAFDVLSNSDAGKKRIEEYAQSKAEPQVERIHETVVEPLPPQQPAKEEPKAATDIDVF